MRIAQKYIIDPRSIMSDPVVGDRVRHGENAESAKTKLAVMQQYKLPESIEAIISQAMSQIAEECPDNRQHLVASIGCKLCSHRAHTTACVADSILNTLMDDKGKMAGRTGW